LSIKERFHINIKKDAMKNLGLTPGPWITRLKEAIFENRSLDATISIPFGDSWKAFSLGELADQIALITPGQKITYITDIAYSPSNLENVISFALDSDHLFIEAAFLDIHADLASKKYHLTAKQAGHIAAISRAKRFTLFHFSPRYTDQEHMLANEAAHAYHQAKGV
jgi:ribonuclease Z